MSFRPVRPIETKTSPFRVGEVFRIMDTVETTRDENQYTSLELALRVVIKLRKFGFNTKLWKTERRHYFLTTNSFLVDPMPRCDELMIADTKILILYLDDKHSYYKDAVEVWGMEWEHLLDKVINSHTSPAECMECGRKMEVEKEEALCGWCITKKMMEMDYSLPYIVRLELERVGDGIAEYRAMRSSP